VPPFSSFGAKPINIHMKSTSTSDRQMNIHNTHVKDDNYQLQCYNNSTILLPLHYSFICQCGPHCTESK
jgi:hypothetical protein